MVQNPKRDSDPDVRRPTLMGIHPSQKPTRPDLPKDKIARARIDAKTGVGRYSIIEPREKT